MKNNNTSSSMDDEAQQATKAPSLFRRLATSRIRFNTKPFHTLQYSKNNDSETPSEESDSGTILNKTIDSFLQEWEQKTNSSDTETVISQNDPPSDANYTGDTVQPDETLENDDDHKTTQEVTLETKQNDLEQPVIHDDDHQNVFLNRLADATVSNIDNAMVPTIDSSPVVAHTDEALPVSTLQLSDIEGTQKLIIDEKKGFGWNGLGSRKIVYDNILKEYRYEIDEPHLTSDEQFIKNKIIYLFRTRVDLDVFDMTDQEKSAYLQKALDEILRDNHIKLSDSAKQKIYYHIFRDFNGYGKIDILMHDECIEDISCDGQSIPIFIYHKNYESILSNIIFDNGDELDSFVVKLSQMSGKQISVYEPVVDGKLLDGSRLQTTLGRTITQHSTFTIRKFREDPLTPIDLIENNTMSVHMAAYFWMAIEQSSSILFCGGTATGKTTMLNALSLFLPAAYKIVSIEDTREINLPHENWIAGTTRTGFSSSDATKTGKDIDMFDLVRIALRQRPKAIIVGEIRGREAYTLFQAMTTGHLSYSTIHASNLHALIQRLESPPISLPRVLLTSLDLVVFLNSVTIKGSPARRVTDVTEIIKLDPDSNRLVTMTPFRWVSEAEDIFESNGGSRILNRIKIQHGWTDEQLHEELNNRMVILDWMRRNNLRSYHQVGLIVSEYHKDPEAVLKKVQEDSP
jgi:flagellar protein FlaI